MAPCDCTTTPAALRKVVSIAALSDADEYSLSGSDLTETTTLKPSLVPVDSAITLFLPRKLRIRSGFSAFQIPLSLSCLSLRFLMRPCCSSLSSAENTRFMPPCSPPSGSTHTGFSSRSATQIALGAPAGTRFHAACLTSYSSSARYVVTRVTL